MDEDAEKRRSDQMTKEEFKILCKIMKAVYTQSTFLQDADAFKVWYELLEDLDYTVAQVAILKYILTNKFPPTVADIRKNTHRLL